MPLFSAYATTLPSKNEANDCFYQSLDEALYHIPRNDKLFLLGDFNARVGQNRNMEQSAGYGEVKRLIGKTDKLGPVSSFHNNRKSVFWTPIWPINKKINVFN